jgi:hypothetical protein
MPEHMRFAFLAKHRHIWPVSWMCEVLEVSRSGFHAWLKRPLSDRAILDAKLITAIDTSFKASDRTYGARRVWHDVLDEGLLCGLHRIERLMRQNALKARPKRRGKPGDDGERSVIADNILDRDFEADRPNQKRLAARATGPGQHAKSAFGKLYAALSNLYADDPDFDAFRKLLRDCILDHWPYAPGEELLGKPVVARRKHSISSAAEEIGVGQKLVRQFLIEAGAVAQDDPRPDARLVFDAEQHKALLAEIPTLVGPIAMQDALGATKMELIALEEEGLLAPRTRIPSVKNVWRISDGHGLLTKLLARAVTITADDADWETLLLTRKRTGIGLAKMMDAIDDGSLDVGTRQGVAGFHGIAVRLEQLAPLIAAKAAPDPTDGGRLQSAAAFGRSIGLRDNGSFAALIEAGYVSAKARVHPGTKRMQYWMDEADIAAFTARFATPTMLIAETGLHRNTLYKLLDAARVEPFAPNGKDFGAVFLRSDLNKVPRFAPAPRLEGPKAGKRD